MIETFGCGSIICLSFSFPRKGACRNMIVEIVTKTENCLTPKERVSCSRLHFGSNRGLMWEYFKKYGSDKKSRVILAKHRHKVVGWAFIFFDNSLGEDLELHVYVAKKYRRMGIGSMLLDRAILICRRRKMACFVHNGHSKAAYNFYTPKAHKTKVLVCSN